jgi:hypothetical protein
MPSDFSGLLEPVARYVLGEPVNKGSGKLHFGLKGNVIVDPAKNTFYDCETGVRGSVPKFVKTYADVVDDGGTRSANEWLKTHGFYNSGPRQKTLRPAFAAPEAATNPSTNRVAAALESAQQVPESDEAAIARLAAMPPMEYDRVRKVEAKRLGAQLSTLDRLVAAERGDDVQADSPFADVAPWPDPVDGDALLSAITRAVHGFIVCDGATAQAAALWIAMTWFMGAVDVAPIATITAPEKRCGKSQLLTLIGRLANRPLTASNITPAALFRAVELWEPTLLIDEADAFMKENEELRGLLNCGHTRDSAYVVRTVGDDHTPKMFNVWGAKAIAGIGHMADTIMDRSVTLELRRKLPNERVNKLRHAAPGLFDDLRAQLARWSEDNADAVRAARPELPAALHDRAADNWEPLLKIAQAAGGDWPEAAQRAALKLSGGEADTAQSAGNELLADIKTVFDARGVQKIAMADLLAELLADEEASWKTWNRGREMTLRQLGKKLSEYGIKSQPVKVGYETHKGYKVEQFTDAFARYLNFSSPATPENPVTRLQPAPAVDFRVTKGVTVTEPMVTGPETPGPQTAPGKPIGNRPAGYVTEAKNPLVTPEPAPILEGNRVTGQKGVSGEKKKSLDEDEAGDLFGELTQADESEGRL